MKSRFLVFSFGTVSLIAGCGAASTLKMVPDHMNTPNGMVTYTRPANNNGIIEKIIGTNDLVKVSQDGSNIPAKYLPLIDAFGLISMGCTATHIGNGVVLTAGHCLSAPETRTNNVECPANVTVSWGLRASKTPNLKSKCVKILAYELNDSRDYAIFTVDNVPRAKIAVNLTQRVPDNTVITIFGHPQARPLEWSQTCTVQPGTNGGWGIDQFSHQCDTEPGNSGSTVIDDTTLQVVGIHDGGMAPWNYTTYIFNTPLAEILGSPIPDPIPDPTPIPTPGSTPIPDPTPAPTPSQDPAPSTLDDLKWGTLGNDEYTLLTTFDGVFQNHQAWTNVSFNLSTDTEKNRDKVTVINGNGAKKIYSGKMSVSLKNLVLPVKVYFKSDKTIISKSVALTQISFSNSK